MKHFLWRECCLLPLQRNTFHHNTSHLILMDTADWTAQCPLINWICWPSAGDAINYSALKFMVRSFRTLQLKKIVRSSKRNNKSFWPSLKYNIFLLSNLTACLWLAVVRVLIWNTNVIGWSVMVISYTLGLNTLNLGWCEGWSSHTSKIHKLKGCCQ